MSTIKTINNLNNPHAGHAVWYSLTSVPVHDLRAAAQAHGFDETSLPSPPSPEACLGRAVKAACNALSKALPDGLKLTPSPIGRRGKWQVDLTRIVDVDGTVSKGLQGTPICRAIIDNDALVLDDLGTDDGFDLAQAIRIEYERRLDILTSNDVSLWLTKYTLPQASATPLRSSGGIYYVPPTRTSVLERVINAVHDAQAGRMLILDVVDNDRAASAVLHILLSDMQRQVDDIQDQIDRGVGTRALAARTRDCEALRERVKQYESVLGQAAAKVVDLLDATEDALIDAKFEAETAQATDSL